ncbi:P-type ATPase, putative [Leishmania tarentolae]|uniref:P-type ATPase, putative n=1 Tax=Leishmania tarentolae TaxID=5689 RepID=A0A640K8R4_LEITA|nr:P-type ATPase, putative [Leishmania tarentolae]
MSRSKWARRKAFTTRSVPTCSAYARYHRLSTRARFALLSASPDRPARSSAVRSTSLASFTKISLASSSIFSASNSRSKRTSSIGISLDIMPSGIVANVSKIEIVHSENGRRHTSIKSPNVCTATIWKRKQKHAIPTNAFERSKPSRTSTSSYSLRQLNIWNNAPNTNTLKTIVRCSRLWRANPNHLCPNSCNTSARIR